ncbi:MAG: NAD(P)H-hydrate epimerase, partial [Mariniblastus sp.]|nr:NAD(P)H-hydrate epimerase [Mariniblastus sp.]
MRILTKEQAAQIDRCANTDFGISGLMLMENAGRGASDLLCALQVSSPIVVCCGKGNNAGDGYVIARHLLARSFEVTVLNWENSEKIRGDA